MSVNCIRCVKNRRTGTDLLCDGCRDALAYCKGCGLPVQHKMCVAHGTPAYCNPDHPAFGDEDAIEALKGPATKRCRVPGCRNKFDADDDSMYCPSCVKEFGELENAE